MTPESRQSEVWCDHANTPRLVRPVPDWTGTCPDCGERIKHDGRGGFITVREVNERLAQQRHLTFDPDDIKVIREALFHAVQRGDVSGDERHRMHKLYDKLRSE